MSRFWSDPVHALSPYVPGEQPKSNSLVKLNTNYSLENTTLTGHSEAVVQVVDQEISLVLVLPPTHQIRGLGVPVLDLQSDR